MGVHAGLDGALCDDFFVVCIVFKNRQPRRKTVSVGVFSCANGTEFRLVAGLFRSTQHKACFLDDSCDVGIHPAHNLDFLPALKTRGIPSFAIFFVGKFRLILEL